MRTLSTPTHSHPTVPYFRYAYLVYCAISAAIGFCFFGYYLGQLNNISQLLPCNLLPPWLSPESTVQPFLGVNLPPCIPMSAIQFSFANAILPLGGIFGAIIFGQVTERFGRLRAMQFQTIPYILAPLALTFSNSYSLLLIGRFVAGMGTGGTATTVPIYLSEISPLHLRGTFGILSATAISTGLAVAALMGFFFGTEVPDWRWIMAVPFFVAVFQAVLLIFCAESPRWLGLNESEKKNEKSLIVYRQLGHHPLATTCTNSESDHIASHNDNDDPQQTPDTDTVLQSVTVRDFLTQSDQRPSLIILAIAHASQQLCGINIYYAYSFFILTMVLSEESIRMFYLIFAFSIIPITYFPGLLVDRFGRRPLLLFSMIGMAISSALLTISVVYNVPGLTLAMFVGAAVIFSVGLSNIPFILVSEVVDSRAVSVASSVAQIINFASNFIILFVFPLLLNSIGPYTFLFFTGYLAIAAFALAMVLPETKGRSSADVVDELRALKY